MGSEKVGQVYSQTTRKVDIANSSGAELLCLTGQGTVSWSIFQGESDDAAPTAASQPRQFAATIAVRVGG